MDVQEIIEKIPPPVRRFWWVPVGGLAAFVLLKRGQTSNPAGSLPLETATAPAYTSGGAVVGTTTTAAILDAVDMKAKEDAQQLAADKEQFSFWLDPYKVETQGTGRTVPVTVSQSRYDILNSTVIKPAQDAQQAAIDKANAATAAAEKAKQDQENRDKNPVSSIGNFLNFASKFVRF